MVESYEELHQLISSEIENYLAQHEDASIKFDIAENGSCSMSNTENSNKFVFMFARFGEEYKVGFAFYEGFDPNPCWIDDVSNDGFDSNFVQTLIVEHLM
ncbi:MAG: hypothetical protein DSZ27_06685 [Thiomicrospira sp.]|nr:MAG: hypothetical protein DSZ27_06685 [Thiomicrospira sp.]